MVLVEVFNRIYIGNIHDANDVYKLINLKIRSVLSCVYCNNLDWCHKDIKDHKVFFKHDFLNCKKKFSRITGNISHEEIIEQVETEKEKEIGKEKEKQQKTKNNTEEEKPKPQTQTQTQQQQQQGKEEDETDDSDNIGQDHPDYYFTKCAHYDFIVFPKEIKTAKTSKEQANCIFTSLNDIKNDVIIDFCKPPNANGCETTPCNILYKEQEISDLKTKPEEKKQKGEEESKEKEPEEKQTKEDSEQSTKKQEQIINMLKCEEATNDHDNTEENKETFALNCAELNECISKDNTIPLTNVYKIKHLYLDINDSYNENILNFVEKAHEFIDSTLAKNESILIHCFAGISRCSTIILSYISKKNKKGIGENYAAMTKKYPFAHPNEHFFQQLLLYEKMNYNLNGYTKYHLVFKQLKRKFDNTSFYHLASLNLLDEKNPTHKFQCKFCRLPLFNNNDIVEHDLKKYNIKKSLSKKNYGQLCTNIFIRKPIWLATEQNMKGVIYCPNARCKAKLGKWSWTGICCSCGYLQFGAFMINESNVDRMIIEETPVE